MSTDHRPTVIIVGAGAAGTLAALHLVRTAARRSTRIEILLVDPADRLGAGTAFGTSDETHLLNVPAAGMSALPEDPGHFVAWRRRSAPDGHPYEFAPRRAYARYLDETLRNALLDTGGEVTLSHLQRSAVRVDPERDAVRVGLDDGSVARADAVLVATGLPAPGADWAPIELKDSPFFVPDPWSPGALEVVRRDRVGPPDVLLVGTGLTMVDVAHSLCRSARPDRIVRAISRAGLLPRRHADTMLLPVIPEITDWGRDLEAIKEQSVRHLHQVWSATGDWRPAVDGLRFQLSALWGRLDESDRSKFLAHHAGAWNRLRHRVPPTSADQLAMLVDSGTVTVAAAQVQQVEPLPRGGLRVTSTDGAVNDVGWVVNCTGPTPDVLKTGNPLLDDLARPRAGGLRLAVPSTANMGFRTLDGRLVASSGDAPTPIWVLGALRRGELWESTAVPEIRTQALALAGTVLDEIAPLPRRLADGRIVSGRHPVARPRDPLGLPLSSTAEAAKAYNAGLERVMRLQAGAEQRLIEATELDPGFALAHAALAMLGHEAGADTDVEASLRAAQESVQARGDDRERSLVDVVAARVRDHRQRGNSALLAHVAAHPRDVLAVSAAVPTIAFSGVTDVRREAWQLVEGLAPAYGDHWWFLSLLAFTRADQSRFEEAGLLAEGALACEPASGHAAHALAHVLYETGQHETGRAWLDHWIAENGRSANHRAHFSWHAALHELALGDTEAVRRRYYSELAPPAVSGVRSLIDSASLLWRWQVTTGSCWGLDGGPVPPVRAILDAVDPALVHEPETPFAALHAAIALAAAGDAVLLLQLAAQCRRSSDPALSIVVATICDALHAVCQAEHAAAAELLSEVMPRLPEVGGSAAQREVIEETLLFCLLHAGRSEPARELLSARLDRRTSPLDDLRRMAV